MTTYVLIAKPSPTIDGNSMAHLNGTHYPDVQSMCEAIEQKLGLHGEADRELHTTDELCELWNRAIIDDVSSDATYIAFMEVEHG